LPQEAWEDHRFGAAMQFSWEGLQGPAGLFCAKSSMPALPNSDTAQPANLTFAQPMLYDLLTDIS
jgi:hypothetical protein